MYSWARRLLFKLDPEDAHTLVTTFLDQSVSGRAGDVLRQRLTVVDPRLAVNLWGLQFPNPVGLAAGFDKDATHLRSLRNFGFGHIEIGTVTGQAQPGNPRPRLFRLPQDEALLNRMGFNNGGCDQAARRLAQRPPGLIVGGNIGKTKAVPLDEANADYEKSFRALYDHVDYFVVNVSSPNTPGLRDLQAREPLEALLGHLQGLNRELGGGQGRPLLVKIAPDLTFDAIEEVLEVVEHNELAGIVATNTTISRSGLATRDVESLGPGGVSGAPVRSRSLEVVRFIHDRAPNLPIVAVGGIFDAADAIDALCAGASLVQIWTGFIYRGPTIVHDINRGLVEGLDRLGASKVSDLA